MLIYAAISGVRNVMKKEAEKILKYEDLTIEIQCMWNVKIEVIPLIIGATGTISKSFRKYLSNISGKQKIKEIKKTVILDTVHTVWEVQMSTCKTFNMGNNITCTMNLNYRTAATQYTLQTWFFSGIQL
jgi:hypothetical protein